MNPLLAAGGLILLLFLPGFLLLAAIFPRHRWFGVFHAVALPAMSVALSAALLVIVGSVLGFLPGGPGGRGWFQGTQTGAPVLEIVFAALCIVLFFVAYGRGAFPRLGRAARKAGWKERGEPEDLTALRDLRLEEARLRSEVTRVRRRARRSRDPGIRNALAEAADGLDQRRRIVAARARESERRAGERRYG